MKPRLSPEFTYQLFALLIAIIVVHAVYVGAIRPSADAQLQQQLALQAAGEDFVPERTLAVVIRDFEQEACFILLFWALAIMAYKARNALREQALLQQSLLEIPEGTSVLPEDAREYSRSLEALPGEQQDFLLPRTLLSALQRFATTGSIQAVSDTIREHCEVESDRLDSELSMVRYIAWAIPSIGFIGTVRGIGDALGQAYKAVEGDITGVTVSLGVAFNSTFVALVLSIIIMFCLHQLQQSQERLVLDCQRYADKRLLRFLVAH
ncbi:MotA/TolQ/ExbB proton channel family protein [Kineobactrum salinum]|uniref:MotA/TolQ/ExbB proton channel family protein n=1 Tax=Kineobactrum salinum TaxID=2708301 RepID=A0A6C0U6H8_9GAMM|nr:MotA/TolQ/ExbB proton channel family protein [Kineobactrum salinum]QIB66035.1 MotA/TolQ/ExbB proton channel family protein [Kineobactrum salinum]